MIKIEFTKEEIKAVEKCASYAESEVQEALDNDLVTHKEYMLFVVVMSKMTRLRRFSD